jgi:hypothetical protein
MTGQQAGAVGLGILGAIAGSFVGMPALGFSIGWTAGSWIGGALDPPKDQITDFGAQAFPPLNSAVRGTTITVLFGTNRVSSQIAYQGNYQTIRTEQSAPGGKGGGSGGGGKGGGGPRTANYEYKLDIVYHMGMSPVPVSLINAWIGAEKLKPEVINSIEGAVSGTTSDAEIIVTASKVASGAQQGLTFESAKFFNGSMPQSTSWQPIIDETGIDVRWPGTAWVGFAGLSLGSTPVIPQISWEIGVPDTVAVNEPEAVWVNKIDNGTTSTLEQADIVPGGPDEFGNMWYMPGGIAASPTSNPDTNRILVVDRDGNILTEHVPVDLFHDWATTVVPSAPSLSGSNNGHYYLRISGTKIIALVCANNGVTGTYYWLVGEVGEDGSIAFTGGCYSQAGNIFTILNWGGPGIHFAPDGTGKLLCFGNLFGNALVMTVGPTIGQIEGVYNGLRISHASQYCATGACVNFGMSNNRWWTSAINGSNCGFMLYDPINDYYFINFYCSPGLYSPDAVQEAAALAEFESNLPNGGIIRFVMDAQLDTGLYGGSNPFAFEAAIGGAQYLSNCFSDNGDLSTYLVNDQIDFTTGASANSHYTPYTYCERRAEGVFLVIFSMPINADPSYADGVRTADSDYYIRFSAYIWDALSDQFVLYSAAGGAACKITEFLDVGTPAYGATGRGVAQTQFEIDANNNIFVYFTTSYAIQDLLPSRRIGKFKYGTYEFTGTDVTPPYVIQQILVNSTFGLYPGKDIIDAATYAVAVNYCEQNNIKISCQYRNDGQAQKHIEQLLAIYDGFLVVDVTAGKVKFGVTELNNTAVRTIDNSHLLRRGEGVPPVNTTKGAAQDTYNLIRIKYMDRALDYKQNEIEEGDEVSQDLTGVRMREFPPNFVMSEYVARRMANRALWANLYTRDAHQFYLGWKDADLEPGDVVTLVDSFTNLRQTVQLTRWKEIERGVFEVNAAQLLQYIPDTNVDSSFWNAIDWAGVNSSYVSQSRPSSGFALRGAPGLHYAAAYELPQEFSTDGLARVYVGWVPADLAAGANLYVSADGTTFGLAQTVAPHMLYGLLRTPLPAAPAMTMERNVRIALLATSYSVASGPLIHGNETLSDVGQAAMHTGVGIIWVGSEMIAYNGVTLIGQNEYELARVYRGWGSTIPGVHARNATLWKHSNGLFARDFTDAQIGQTLIYKVVPFGFDGSEYNVASISAQSYTILGTHYRPNPPSAIDFDGRRGLKRLAVNSTVDMPLTWKDGSRNNGFGYGGAGANPGGFGGFVRDTASLGWRVNVVGSGNVTVRSTFVTTPAFTYTSSMNFEDNGAWRGNPAIVVTPRNQYGDAMTTSVISMELFS